MDEIIIFEDNNSYSSKRAKGKRATPTRDEPDAEQYTAFSHPSHFLAHLLSYLETPSYLRRSLFGIHPNLRTAGTLPSLDMPHHLRADEWCEYREGVTVPDESSATKVGSCSSSPSYTLVDVGLSEPYIVHEARIAPSTRVTLRINGGMDSKATAVAPWTPRREAGYYWGYDVRTCSSLSTVLSESPYDSGYDLLIGTSERGDPISTILAADVHGSSPRPQRSLPRHTLIVFGGVAGLEAAAAADPALHEQGVYASNVGDLFDYWVNVLPGQGSRTIRTEEAVWLGLMGLRDLYRPGEYHAVVDHVHEEG